IDAVRETPGAIQVFAHSLTRRAVCPSCQRVSACIHSYYGRTLKDLPSVECIVQLQLPGPRFRCLNAQCQRATFCESLKRLARKHARRAERFRGSCYTLGLVSGGEAEHRTAHRLRLPLSADNVLRDLRRTPLQLNSSPLRVIGIDDWAFKGRESFG